jgi:hypothetical protein
MVGLLLEIPSIDLESGSYRQASLASERRLWQESRLEHTPNSDELSLVLFLTLSMCRATGMPVIVGAA